jgi:hypothetical protein
MVAGDWQNGRMPSNLNRRSLFPLARTSRRRRRLVSGQVELDAAELQTTVGEMQPQQAPIARDDSAHGEPLELLRIQSSLEATQPLTWVFTGDNLRDSSDAETGSFVELFGDTIRKHLRRLLDVVVDTGISNGRMTNLLDTLDWRVTRFEPDVVVITIAEGDILDDKSDCESSLATIIEALRDSNSIVVLNAPQRLLPIGDKSIHTANRITTIRELAHLYGTPLLEYPVSSRMTDSSSIDDRSRLPNRHAVVATMLRDVFEMNQ